MSITSVYIKEVVVDNFKSLRNSKIELNNGLNVIIGKNGVGKSNILEFISKYASKTPVRGPRTPIRNINTNYSIVLSYIENRKKNELSIVIEKKKNDLPSREPNYEIILNKSISSTEVISNFKTNLSQIRDKKETELRNELLVYNWLRSSYIKFKLPEISLWVDKPQRFTIDKEESVNIEYSYRSLSFFFKLELDIEFEFIEKVSKKIRNNNLLLKDYIKTYLDNYLELSGLNKALFENTTIQEIRFNPNINLYSNDEVIIVENLTVEFLIENDWMPWSFLSDGTKRLFYIISEIISHPVGIILLEEPEIGIHPHQLYKIMDFLKEQSRTRQIIMSTHSPLVLDVLNEKELNRIVIASYKRGTKFKHLGKTQIYKAKRYMKEVGELSYYWLHSDLEL